MFMFLAERLRYREHDCCLVLDFEPPPYPARYSFDGHILFEGTRAECEAFIAEKLRADPTATAKLVD